MMDQIAKQLKDYLLEQADFRDLFEKNNITPMSFEEAVDDTVQWVTSEENYRNYCLDKKYLDISWLVVGDQDILNLDDIWDYFKCIITEN